MSALGDEEYCRWLLKHTDCSVEHTRYVWLEGWSACEKIWRGTQSEIDVVHKNRVEYWINLVKELTGIEHPWKPEEVAKYRQERHA